MKPLLQPGETCWRIERAKRIAFLVDNQSYFAALSCALRAAKRSVLLLGWEFDPRTGLAASGAHAQPADRIGNLLRRLAEERPALDIHVLIWAMALPISAGRGPYRQRAYQWLGEKVHLWLDDRHPAGACHHQKMVVIDDALAFCGGADFAGNRWDSAAHLDADPRRRLPSGKPHPPRHEVTIAVDGDAAAALGDLARARWERASGERLAPPAGEDGSIWPKTLIPHLTECRVAIARTQAAYAGTPAIRENEALYLAGIAAARRLIYLENQYFTSPLIGEALEARLVERDGPQIVAVLPGRSPSYFDHLTMDGARDALIARLEAADRQGRFHAYTPVTARGLQIVVHSKLMIVDDRLLRAGSSNVNNRSMGLDTECDLAMDAALAGAAGAKRTCRAIAQFRRRLVGHYIRAAPEDVASAEHRHDSLVLAIEALQRPDANHLRRLRGERPELAASLIANYHLGDPESPADTFRPWRRRAGP